jgi:hypothetical protein
MRIVVVGGLGNFGARICKRLAEEPGLDVIATSRRPHSGSTSVKTALLDLDSPDLVWQELKREQFSFGRRFAAACDVPDLELFPARYPGVRTVTFRAALEVALQHYVLWTIAACTRMGLALPVARWGAFLNCVGKRLNWLGSDIGGMRVNVVGMDSSLHGDCRVVRIRTGVRSMGPIYPHQRMHIMIGGVDE